MNESFVSLMSIALGAILVGNVVFSQLLGAGPFLGGSGSVRNAVRMGLAVTLVMGLTSAACWPVNEYILVPNGLKYMETTVFFLIAVFLVWIMDMLFQKLAPARKTAMGSSLPLSANCAALGIVFQNVQNGSGFLQSVTYALAGGVGFLLAVVLFAGIRERLEFADCPKPFEGVPIALAAAGLLSLCFAGFSGLSFFG